MSHVADETPERHDIWTGDGRMNAPPVGYAGLVLILGLQGVLAFASLRGDSITFDETSHLASGLSYWLTGDYRLASEHPPLPKMWCALPLLMMEPHWIDRAPGWEEGDFWRVGNGWFTAAPNREALLTAARCMMVLLLLSTTFLVYVTARRMWNTRGALMAAAVAALCPTMLAHGRLVTTDLPAAFFALLVLERFSTLLEAPGPARLLTAALALAGFALSKFSWPLIVPPLLVMAALGVLRNKTVEQDRLRWRATRSNVSEGRYDLGTKPRIGLLILMAGGLLVALVVWLTIWTAYGWRFTPFSRHAGEDHAVTDPRAWSALASDTGDEPAASAPLAFLRTLHGMRLLPEAYLYGLAYTLRSAGQRESYLCGEYSPVGWRSYFPIAFAVKTPPGTLVLIVLACAAILQKRLPNGGSLALRVGCAAFLILYALSAVLSHLNIGHRHLLPLYPILYVLIGAAESWTRSRAGRFAVGGCMAALALSTFSIHPHYLSYFSELVGGSARGHRYLADSNLDWGQDMKRLAAYAARHPDQRIKLAWFGSVDPRAYGLNVEMLPSSFPFGPPAELSGGTYVCSVTQLLGVYLPEAQPDNEGHTRELLRQLLHDQQRSDVASDIRDFARESPSIRYLRSCLLMGRLRRLAPQERIGWSLWVYRLTAEQARMFSLPDEPDRFEPRRVPEPSP